MNICWLEQGAGDVPPGDVWLSERERTTLAGLRIPKRSADWRLGRWTAKCAVAGYLELAPHLEALAAIEVRPAPSGAPEVFLRGQPAPVVISLSHSHGAGLCGIAPSGASVGCDLEWIEPRSPSFLADYFTVEEQKLVARTPADRQDSTLTLLWSAKESALKALCCGLRSDTRSVRAVPENHALREGEEWRKVSVAHTGGRTFSGWWRESGNLIYTLVADPTPARLAELSFGCLTALGRR